MLINTNKAVVEAILRTPEIQTLAPAESKAIEQLKINLRKVVLKYRQSQLFCNVFVSQLHVEALCRGLQKLANTADITVDQRRSITSFLEILFETKPLTQEQADYALKLAQNGHSDEYILQLLIA